MKPSSNTLGSTIAEVVERRSPAGPNDSVQGWHNLLKKILFQMAPYLREGRLVTFRTMKDQEGIVLACRKNDFNVVIDALLAKPPFTPAIDVYDKGQLLAGYTYNTIDECIGDLTKVLQIHLSPGANQT